MGRTGPDTILEAGRIALLPEVADAFAEFIDEAEGRRPRRAHLGGRRSKTRIDVQQIEAALLGASWIRKVETTPSVDPALLGGFVARVGNYRIDLSLKAKLDGLARQRSPGFYYLSLSLRRRLADNEH